LIFAAAILAISKLNFSHDQPFRPFFPFGRGELTIGVIRCMFSAMLNYRQAAAAS